MAKIDLFSLEGRVGIVTGAGGHLGHAMARGLADAGAHVALVGRSPAPIEALAREIEAGGGSAEPVTMDIGDGAAMLAAVHDLGLAHGRLDFIVNNAYSGRTATVEQATADDFEQTYAVTVTAPFLLVQAALPLLRAAAEGRGGTASVVNIVSMYGLVSPDPRIYGESGQNSPPFYASAKAGLLQLTRYLACHLAPDGIRVNSISPGPFPKASVAAQDPDFTDRLKAKVPLGRLGTPDDLEGAVIYLASDASAFVNGANLVVDGGWTAW
jgi:NAD(P)-dependent dehydrogenase (short-subunit alcohol dehydrogenase family)